jgi:excisionase family DNA binding protein
MSDLADKFDLLTLADAAQLLHCSKAQVCKAVAGRVSGCAPIPCVSLGRRRLIRRESLRRWLEANERIANGDKLTTLPVWGAGKRG